ncbi:LANO_0H03334g1_1 [Lachancea nothofagi CBS 11611]|uniref:Protein IBD2 n=1 Tax=Lachancea nothofagi CBS 11611 TaxID=1266666 RepID=A0A1G4KL97_9SACH|nr:LANO_0H03334g1_1 [Lachancea nothofagi CBS 11611]
MSSFKDTSIEIISEDGPADFNVMMQEGVKALTKILTNHLQDNPGFLKQQSMKMMFKDDAGGGLDPRKVFEVDGKGDNWLREIDEEAFEASELDNKSNYHTYQAEVPTMNGELTKPALSEDAAAKHAEGEGEIVFDYGEQDLMSLPGDFGDNLKKMVASSIAQQDLSGAQRDLDIDFDVNVDVDVNLEETHGDRGHNAIPHGSQHRPNRQNCRHHDPGAFEYPRNPKRTPDFASLITNDEPLCMFCEYYFVFGEPPKNMIRWFQRDGGNTSSAPCNSHTQH